MSASLYESLQRVEKREWVAVAGLAAIVAVCFFVLLGGVPLLGKDEPRYAQVAREMYESGDWITPRLAGHVWFEKPALPYWLMAAGYAVFGPTEFAARIGVAILAAIGVAWVYAVGRHAAGPSRAFVSALTLATSPLWFAFARAASFDMPLAATMTGALGAFYFYECAAAEQKRRAWAGMFGAWVGASMLAKGLAGPLLLGIVVIAYLTVARSWRRLRLAHVALAAVAALVVAATWYAPVILRNGWPFIDEFIINHHFRRYLTNKYHHPQPVYFYPLVILAGALPWAFVVFAWPRDLARRLVSRPSNDDDRLVMLAGLSVIVPLVFFSLSTSKLPGYILPVFPGVALLAGWSMERIIATSKGRWTLFATALTLAGLGVGMASYARTALQAPAWEVAVIAVPLVAAAAIVGYAVSQGRVVQAVSAGGVGMAVVVLLIALFVYAELGARESLRELSVAASHELRPSERVLLFGVVEYSAAFYADGRLVVDPTGEILVADSFDQVTAAIDGSPDKSVLCLTDADRLAQLEASGRFQLTRLGEQRNRLLVRVATLQSPERP